MNIAVANPRGGSASSSFAVHIAPWLVTNGDDSGPGSLRAIAAVAQHYDLVAFAPDVTKVQLASPIGLDQGFEIDGPGASVLTVDGGGGEQVFAINSAHVMLNGMTITNAKVGIAVFHGDCYLDSLVVTNNSAVGLSVYGTASTPPDYPAAEVTNSTFSNNPANGAIMQTDGDSTTATGIFTNCTFTGNGNGVTAITNAAGQLAHIGLAGGTQVHDNTQNGVVLEIDNNLGRAELEATPSSGVPLNQITKNPVGVRRVGPVPSDAVDVIPASMVTANTTDFQPAWP